VCVLKWEGPRPHLRGCRGKARACRVRSSPHGDGVPPGSRAHRCRAPLSWSSPPKHMAGGRGGQSVATAPEQGGRGLGAGANIGRGRAVWSVLGSGTWRQRRIWSMIGHRRGADGHPRQVGPSGVFGAQLPGCWHGARLAVAWWAGARAWDSGPYRRPGGLDRRSPRGRMLFARMQQGFESARASSTSCCTSQSAASLHEQPVSAAHCIHPAQFKRHWLPARHLAWSARGGRQRGSRHDHRPGTMRMHMRP
jgi:hypothetical protein